MPTQLRCLDTGTGRLPAEPENQTGVIFVANDPPIRSQLATLQSQLEHLLTAFSTYDQKVDKLLSQHQEEAVNMALLGSRLERLSRDFEEVKTQTEEHNTWSATTAAEFQKRVEALEQSEKSRAEDRRSQKAFWIAVLSMVATLVGTILHKFL